MIILFFSLLTAFSLHASELAPDLAHPFYLFPEGHLGMQSKAGFFTEEHEYEKAKVVQDLFEYKHNFYKISATAGLENQRQVGVEFSLQDRGTLDKKYSSNINLPQQSIPYKGFHAIELFLQQHLETQTTNDKLAIEIRFKGSPLNGKETNNTYQGKDIALSFLYSHLHKNEWRIYGDLHAEIIGKKKIKKFDGENEIISPYSQFGNLIGIQWLRNNFWIEFNGLFYLTTDYNSESPNYVRLTDKGFVIGGKFLIGLYLTPKTVLTLDHIRSGSNFNVITESNAESTEFEIETQYTQLGISWFF